MLVFYATCCWINEWFQREVDIAELILQSEWSRVKLCLNNIEKVCLYPYRKDPLKFKGIGNVVVAN